MRCATPAPSVRHVDAGLGSPVGPWRVYPGRPHAGEGTSTTSSPQDADLRHRRQLGKLWYAGYSIDDLAKHATFEEVVHLVHHRRLPTPDELDDLNELMVERPRGREFLAKMMPTLAEQTSPMSMLRTSVSAASAYDPDGWDQSAEAQLPQGPPADLADAPR